ncbi:hypothetical protein B7L70_11135 [Vulcanisaeta sp. EB80]|uniref:hypothetical protein n=1 Tax=Vulcanisaeta sp. EB80 TaxID=1650660 RepID=UPI0009C0424E|nr:hypothetical protein [Vulcanisaeta sp. EB80]PLC64125.1 hypothetical protein B7L70_11135 [Vulcanisaeta sp. EB80]
MRSQVALAIPPPSPSPTQTLYGTLMKTHLYNTFLEYTRPYIEHVLNEPEAAEEEAQKLLNDTKFLYLLNMLSQDAALTISEDKLRETCEHVRGKFKEFGIDIEDPMEIILEHELWKLRQIRENFDKFTTMLLNFAAESPEDAYRYAVILTALTLLLIASLNAKTREKLESIANEIRELTDELELYTLTFMVALEENEEENKAVTTARSPEELRKALEAA